MTKIKYMGCEYKEPDDFIFDVPNGMYHLMMVTNSPGVFWVDGVMTEYPAGCAVFFRPNQRILYGASKGSFINDWVCFSTTDTFINSAPLPHGVPFELEYADYCRQLFQLIALENSIDESINSYKELSITNLIMILLHKFIDSFNGDSKPTHYRKLIELRQQIVNDAGGDWTVKRMADALHISPGYMQALYKKTFGISCIDDVINNRVRMAKEFLTCQRYLISDVALKCGYHSIEHFYRQFKQLTGQTPNEYMESVN
jgi:AraC-like DNA-binding protein